MNQKIIGLIIIAMLSLSALPLTVVAAQTMISMKITQQIDSDLETSVLALSSSSNIDNSITARAKPAPTPKSYALTIEIDYIAGHEPTQSVLDYMTTYYQARNIMLTINVNDAIPLDESFSNGVSDIEFWNLEATYNDGLDSLDEDSDYDEYIMPEKWVLYGTSVEGDTLTVGFTYCIGTFRDLVAGNYIFIADEAADAWATRNAVPQDGAEAVLLMHEFGHSIGICVVRAGGEVYCSNYYCVMSLLRTQNAGNADLWYYCSTHWKTKNLDYYVV